MRVTWNLHCPRLYKCLHVSTLMPWDSGSHCLYSPDAARLWLGHSCLSESECPTTRCDAPHPIPADTHTDWLHSFAQIALVGKKLFFTSELFKHEHLPFGVVLINAIMAPKKWGEWQHLFVTKSVPFPPHAFVSRHDAAKICASKFQHFADRHLRLINRWRRWQ
jgi:hypothetical protein